MNQTYLFAYTQGLPEDIQACIKADDENIAAFIAKYPSAPKITMETMDGHFLLNTSLGFIDRCYDQNYLATRLIPVLAPMQMGDREIPEIVTLSESEYAELNPEDIFKLPDWNAWRDYGISDRDFPAFRQDLLEMSDDSLKTESEEMDR